jgi:hypothetical protein
MGVDRGKENYILIFERMVLREICGAKMMECAGVNLIFK